MALFTIKTKIYSGQDSLAHLANYSCKNIWVVCDPFLCTSEALQQLLNAFPQDAQVSLFSDILPDPPIATIAQGVQTFCTLNPDVVIGFGGGSAIDAAKAIIYFGRKRGVDIDCFIAIPTTSGTGSEVTHASVISDPQNKTKYPLFDASLYPDVALLVPQFVVSVPPGVTANTGMDVMTHALEAWVATEANDFTDALAASAFRMVLNYLPIVWQNGADIAAREKMHNAATLAGIAFSQAGLGLNHAIAHQLGGRFHIPHGLANAILLPHVVHFNARVPDTRKKYARLSRECGLSACDSSDDDAVTCLVFAIQKINNYLNIVTNISSLDIDLVEEEIILEDIAEAAMRDKTFITNPYFAGKKEIVELVRRII